MGRYKEIAILALTLLVPPHLHQDMPPIIMVPPTCPRHILRYNPQFDYHVTI
jgi:hypothetical protein